MYIATGTNLYSAAISNNSQTMVVTRRDNYAYISTNKAASWITSDSILTGPTWAFTQGLAVSANGSSILAAQSGVSSLPGYLWSSTDFGR